MNLNQIGMSDYYFANNEGSTFQFSRKQAGELLNNIDEAERQIQKYYNNADENFQIIEGIISTVPLYKKKSDRFILPPNHGRFIYAYSVTETGFIKSEEQKSLSADLYWAWIRGLDRCGVTTFNTINWIDTCKLLVAMYNNECKPADSHTTLKRVIKPRIQIPNHDPFVLSIMSHSWAYKLGIGEKKANALKAAGFNSILDIAMASEDEIASAEGIGINIARKLLKSIGRDDV